MIEFEKLQAPKEHGEVLVAPEPRNMVTALRENAEGFSDVKALIAGEPLPYWRRRARESLLGDEHQRYIVATGHQPEFIHPGVWAKHVVTMRLAQAVDGCAVHLVVDHDAPRRLSLAVPTDCIDSTDNAGNEGVLSLKRIQVASFPNGYAFEQMAGLSRNAITEFENEVRSAFRGDLDRTLMPFYFRGISAKGGSEGWVAQMMAGRQTIEGEFGVSLNEHRTSCVWWTPLLVDLLEHAPRFAAAYNRALHDYRVRYRVRGVGRPIPDLVRTENRCELPAWVYRDETPRRRLFAMQSASALTLWAEHDFIGEFTQDQLRSWAQESPKHLEIDGWKIRPRALTLTMWARLLLCDFFIHGIGGVKYDRITDGIIENYFGVQAPLMGCVSATMFPELPRDEYAEDHYRACQRDLRDVQWNPQRFLRNEEDIQSLIHERNTAAQQAGLLKGSGTRHRTIRKELYHRIRRLNAELSAKQPGLISVLRERVQEAKKRLLNHQSATHRELFFGLFRPSSLEQLLAALPDESMFCV